MRPPERGSALDTNEIKNLTEEQADALAQQEGDLYLDGLTTLSLKAAKALSNHGGYLSLNGLSTLSAEQAEALACREPLQFLPHRLGISLRGLVAISDDAASALSQYHGSLYLDGLKTITAGVAKALSNNQHRVLSFKSLAALPLEAAIELVNWKGEALVLDGLAALSPELAAVLAEFKGDRLYLNGLMSLSGEAAQALTRLWSDLFLNGLTALSDEAAHYLSDEELVYFWAGGSRVVYLEGLTEISVQAAAMLRANSNVWLSDKFKQPK